MHNSRSIFVMAITLSCLATGCYSIDDYINIRHEDPPPTTNPDTPTPDPFNPGGTDSDNTPPSGSSGITPNPDSGNDNNDGPGKIEDPVVLSVKSLSPAHGSVSGGYEIRVIGSALAENGELYFGQTKSPKLQLVNQQVVRALVPQGRPECVDVLWKQGDEKITLPNGFCYDETLTIDDFTPNIVVQGDDVPISISGSGFDSKTRLAFVPSSQNPPSPSAPSNPTAKQLPLYDIRVISNAEIQGSLPEVSPGSYDIIAAGSNGSATSQNELTVLPKLAISQISPNYATAGKKATFTISGSGFDDNTRVRIGDANVATTLDSDSQISVDYSSSTIGYRDVLIYDDHRQKRLERAIYIASPDDNSTIFSITPAFGSTLGGDEVVVSGLRLPDSGSAQFGNAQATVLSRSQNAWKLITPAHNAQSVDVSIASSVLAQAYQFIVYPTLNSISPNSGTKSTVVQLNGTGFDDDLRVFFGAREAQDVTVKSSTTAQVVAPDGSATVDIKLVQGRAEVPSTHSFTYHRNVEIVGQSTHDVVVSGGTTVALYGSGFDSDLVLHVDGQPIDYTLTSSLEIRFTAPAHDVATVDIELLCPDDAQKPCAKTTIEYYDSKTNVSGASGDVIDGALYVNVLEATTGTPIEGATVYIGVDDDAIKRTTDASGRVSIEDPTLKGSQIVVACAQQHACNSLQPVNARYITLYLEKWKSQGSSSETTPPPPPKPDDSGTINPIDVTIPYTPKPAYFTGTVGDFGKVDLTTNPNHIRAGIVMQSALAAYVYPYSKDDVYMITDRTQKYRLRARSGDVALALVCGIYDTETKVFMPRYLGLKRHLVVTDGATLDNHLECNLPLTNNLRIKLLDAPLKSGPNGVKASAFLRLGSDGYIGGFMNGSSETDLVVITGLPPLVNPIDDANFSINVGAYTNGAYPASVYTAERVVQTNETLQVGPAVPIPVFKTESTTDVLKSGIIQWQVEYPQNVDYYVLNVRMYSSQNSGDLIYQAYLPGSATSAELPPVYSWPTDNSGQLYIQITAYKSTRSGFDFNKFSTSELRYNYVHSSAYATLIIQRPIEINI